VYTGISGVILSQVDLQHSERPVGNGEIPSEPDHEPLRAPPRKAKGLQSEVSAVIRAEWSSSFGPHLGRPDLMVRNGTAVVIQKLFLNSRIIKANVIP
jgi:hypothetical protein